MMNADRYLKMLGLALVLLIAGLSCSLFTRSSPTRVSEFAATNSLDLKGTIVSQAATLEALKQIPVRVETLAFPPEPAPIVEPQRLAYFWVDPNGCLATATDSRSLMKTQVCLPDSSNSLLYRAQRWISWSTNSLAVPRLDQNQLLLLKPDGTPTQVNGPSLEGKLVDAKISPDGETIFWLYDVTRVPPDPMKNPPCDASAGCVGREYSHHITDGAGENPTLFGMTTVNSVDFPRMEIAGWLSSSQAVFARLNANIPGLYYPDTGGAILSWSVPFGSKTIVNDEYLRYKTMISLDGVWRAETQDIDHGDALRLLSTAGNIYRVSFDDSDNPLIFQVTFSSDGEDIYWIALNLAKDTRSLKSVQLLRASLAKWPVQEVLWVMESPAVDDLPYITGMLSPERLILSTKSGSRVFDAGTGKWVTQNPPAEARGWILLGALEAE